MSIDRTEFDFNQDCKVSKYNLDSLSEEQAALSLKYGEKVAEAREARDTAKQRLELKKADVELEIRKNPPAEHPKLTEAIVSALVTQNPGVQICTSDLIAATRDLNEWEAAERAIDIRKGSIDNLVRLHGSQYFALKTGERGFRPNDGRVSD